MANHGRRFVQSAGTSWSANGWSLTGVGCAPGFVCVATMKRNQMGRVGKKRAGRLLDGRRWNEMPAPRDQKDEKA